MVLKVQLGNSCIFSMQEWALGLLHTKCVCGLIWLMDFHFKHTLDTVYQAGIRNINLTFILVKVTWPVIAILSLTIAVPYIFFMGIMYSCGESIMTCTLFVAL